MTSAMEFSVLGSLAINHGSAALTVSANKPKKVLALLLLRANTLVSTSDLVDEIWGYDPPRTCVVTLQTYISQLRKALRALQAGSVEPRDPVETVPSGYRLSTRGDELDLHVFQRLSKAGARALAEGRDEDAAGLLRASLELWHGPALADVQHGSQLSLHVNHMEQCRLSVQELCIDADLKLGRHRALLSELITLTSQHPLNESLQGQFMLALHRSGQRAKALEVYQQLRRRLIRELGLEPAPEIRRLHQSILSADLADEHACTNCGRPEQRGHWENLDRAC